MSSQIPASGSRREILAGALAAVAAGATAAWAVTRDDAEPIAHDGTIELGHRVHGGISHVHGDQVHEHPVRAHAMDRATIRRLHQPSLDA